MSIKELEKTFDISTGDMRNIVKSFLAEMENGLSGKASSLKMIPTYVDKPTGKEKGFFLALDLGGTNFRVIGLELKGKGQSSSPKTEKFILERKYITGRGEELFDFIAGCIDTFLVNENLHGRGKINLGFTFSFAVEQRSINSGKLLHWTKGFNATGVIGEDVVKLLEDALRRKGLNNIKVSALANDTVGTLVAKAYEDKYCDVGVIIGTGTNACYRDAEKNMIINIEWGNFNKLRPTNYDIELDRTSNNPAKQILEKMVSGMYLGEVAKLVLRDLIEKNTIFKSADSLVSDALAGFKTEHISEIESDATSKLAKVSKILNLLGMADSTIQDRKMVKKICEMISIRAARISAASLAAVIKKMDPRLLHKHTVAMDGSVYEKHPHFAERMKSALKELFGRKASRIRIELAKDGSGKGAAIIAAVASA